MQALKTQLKFLNKIFFVSKKNNEEYLHMVFNPPYGERLSIDLDTIL